jgi:hypothetical protein
MISKKPLQLAYFIPGFGIFMLDFIRGIDESICIVID